LQNCNALAAGCDEFSNYLRSKRKRYEMLSEEQHDLLEQIIDKFFEEVGEYL